MYCAKTEQWKSGMEQGLQLEPFLKKGLVVVLRFESEQMQSPFAQLYLMSWLNMKRVEQVREEFTYSIVH